MQSLSSSNPVNESVSNPMHYTRMNVDNKWLTVTSQHYTALKEQVGNREYIKIVQHMMLGARTRDQILNI